MKSTPKNLALPAVGHKSVSSNAFIKAMSTYSTNVAPAEYGHWAHITWSKIERTTPRILNLKTQSFCEAPLQFLWPSVVAVWDKEDGTSMRMIKRIDGEPLNKAWPGLTELQKREIAKETAAYLAQVRHLQSSRLHCLGKTGHLYAAFLFPASGYDNPSGPFDSDDKLWAEMAKCLAGLPDKVCRILRRKMPPATPYTFTHGDLSLGNIMVKDGKVTGIIDRERSGYFPRWWEFVCTLPAEDEDDTEWKALLREYIEPHSEAADADERASGGSSARLAGRYACGVFFDTINMIMETA